MRQRYVGTFPLGFENVDVYALPDEHSGYFYCRPDDKHVARIKIGIKSPHWDEAIAVLFHEAFELAMTRMRLRWQISGVNGDHASYTFMFTHSQYCDLCETIGQFLSSAMPALAKVWNKHHKKKS